MKYKKLHCDNGEVIDWPVPETSEELAEIMRPVQIVYGGTVWTYNKETDQYDMTTEGSTKS